MIKECIVLAGGFGTRLREAVPDLPKCMAPVAGRPFLYYVINYMRSQGVERFIFSLGYKHEVIEEYLKTSFGTMTWQSVVETEPLGTGGAIRLACAAATAEQVIVVNGDTLFKVDGTELENFHSKHSALATIALKKMTSFDRYGAVDVSSNGYVTAFREKQFYADGLINGGVYVIDRHRFLALDLPQKFSFEQDFLEKQATADGGKTIAATVQDGYFIDIGIPADYAKAGLDLGKPPLDLAMVDQHWTLFLDRDGVVNYDAPGSYIYNADLFNFMPGIPPVFKVLNQYFKYIIVTTNQRGVGKKLMTEESLIEVNKKMVDGITEAGGKIDRIYYAIDLSGEDPLRKPNPGMAFAAKRDLPDIDLNRSIMIGNNITDVEFGKNAGMYTVMLTTTNHEVRMPHPEIDLLIPTLIDFTEMLVTAKHTGVQR